MSQSFAKFPNGQIWPVQDGERISAQVFMGLDDLMEYVGVVNDTVSERISGSSVGLTDLDYTVIQAHDNQVVLAVGACIQTVQDPDDEDRDDRAPVRATLEEFAAFSRWSDAMLAHAKACGDETYAAESVITTPDGRQIRCPAYPEECSYVRVVDFGFELAYWVCDEWSQTPEDVMGAIMGVAQGGSAEPSWDHAGSQG